MSIDLNLLLLRNKIRLSTFCEEMNILTYDDLVLHCKARDIVPCSREYWAEVFHPPARNTKTTTHTNNTTTRTLSRNSNTYVQDNHTHIHTTIHIQYNQVKIADLCQETD